MAALMSGDAAARSFGHSLPSLPAAAPVQVTLSLQPRHPQLLERLALASSGQRPLPPRLVRALFLPPPREIARVRAVMAASGLRPQSHRGLSMSFTGPAAAAEQAFGVSLQPAAGGFARRASGPPLVPASIAPLVQDVAGLDTTTPLQPLAAGGHAAPSPPPCSAAGHTGGYLPSQLGSAGGYGHSALIAGGYDGGGESVAVVAFSGYRPSDVAAYQACFGSSVPVSDRLVGRATGDRRGSAEVALDIETVISAAPGLDSVHVYIDRPAGTMAEVVNAIVADAPVTGVRIITDSWGLCEPAVTPAAAAATNSALQLAAVSGITFVAASGDAGAYDCGGFGQLAVDDPAAQPFATGVGGTDLRLSTSGRRHEVVWNDITGSGGGGLSRFWPRPGWQAGAGVGNRFSNGHRQVPDVSLHASPDQHGYPVYCTTGACGHVGWMTLGGTSASAPLLAGIVADMNSYSLAHGGARLGFADPFLYDSLAADPAAFRDVTVGSNNPGSAGPYPATSGYDQASGIGAPLAGALAADLAAYTPAQPAFAATRISALPSGARTLRYRRFITLHGVLSDPEGGIAGARVIVQGASAIGVREWRRTTGAHGGWSLRLRAPSRRMHWRAVYLGSETRRPAISGRRTIYVIPPLWARTPAGPLRVGVPFSFAGRTLPALAGRPVLAQIRVAGRRWHRIGPAGVGESGRFRRVMSLPRAGRYRLRWLYHGDRNGRWLSAVSASRLITVG
ncbi:MAG TPA: S53 family peptidase [Gaiellales bacterium]|nr:S53 family peptidase [Gaiellales bacterium]